MEKYHLKLTKSSSEKATSKESRIIVGISPGLSALVPLGAVPADRVRRGMDTCKERARGSIVMESVDEENENPNGESCLGSDTCPRCGSPSRADIGLELESYPRSGSRP
ncbi:hypothetical protein LIER_08442 [Lithospermum erythrorhizon]|uniref:Uncharacterized protein n=1 Tax=Lithospermum erythrorhizon TaxID=34254 RepID=A0AAV3PCT1_LITER